MVCLYCSKDTRVTNSRLQKRANQVWRRRQCLGCRRIFTSLEAIDLRSSLAFITSQNVGEPFSRDRLFISIYESVRHRPTADSDASALTSTVLSKIKPHIYELDLRKIPGTPDKLPGFRTAFSSKDVAMATSLSDKNTSELLGDSPGGVEVLRKSSEAMIKRNDLAKTVAATLKNFDKAAHTYYSAYHPTF